MFVAVGAVIALALLVISGQRSGPSQFHYSGPILARYTTGPRPPSRSGASQIHKIRHIVIIMQESRSFDDYFGTFPGARGIPMRDGRPLVCIPDPAAHHCQSPYHDPSLVNGGGPQTPSAALLDVDRGRMDGFVVAATRQPAACATHRLNNPSCRQSGSVDVMGYHDAREIPNYWTYARDYALQDQMFQPDASWRQPSHLFMVSGWSAACSGSPLRCRNDDRFPSTLEHEQTGATGANWAWTDITYLLHRRRIPWAYYIGGSAAACGGGCSPLSPQAPTRSFSNPLPAFQTVKQDGQTRNIQPVQNVVVAARRGALPAVSWVVPNYYDSEAPPASVAVGQSYVTGLINAIMRSRDWPSTAIFLSWADWGGFYDNAVPPRVDANGYGLRVPALLISPYARHGYVDHQILSQDAYLKFIEDDFLGGQRLDPANDGRPDGRPTVRENVPGLGNLLEDFDFNQAPRPPVLLPTSPAPGPAPGPLQSTVTVPSRQQDARRQGLRITVRCNELCGVTLAEEAVGLPHRLRILPASQLAGAEQATTLRLPVTAPRPAGAVELRIGLDGGAGYRAAVVRRVSIR